MSWSHRPPVRPHADAVCPVNPTERKTGGGSACFGSQVYDGSAPALFVFILSHWIGSSLFRLAVSSRPASGGSASSLRRSPPHPPFPAIFLLRVATAGFAFPGSRGSSRSWSRGRSTRPCTSSAPTMRRACSRWASLLLFSCVSGLFPLAVVDRSSC
jgi:hypothetical protein